MPLLSKFPGQGFAWREFYRLAAPTGCFTGKDSSGRPSPAGVSFWRSISCSLLRKASCSSGESLCQRALRTQRSSFRLSRSSRLSGLSFLNPPERPSRLPSFFLPSFFPLSLLRHSSRRRSCSSWERGCQAVRIWWRNSSRSSWESLFQLSFMRARSSAFSTTSGWLSATASIRQKQLHRTNTPRKQRARAA